MSVTDATRFLEQLGFSEYEARAYVTLLRRNPLNGYELARESGIPRPNIYAVLQKLQERQVVAPLETASGTRYAPLPPDRLTERLGSQFSRVLEAAHQALNAVAETPDEDYVWNVRGYDEMLARARELIAHATSDVLLALWPAEAAALAETNAEATARGIRLTTLCLRACPQPCGACQQERLFRYHVSPEPQHRWLIVVADEAEMLFGEMKPDASVAMQTRQSHLIRLASWFVRHSIALATIVETLGPELEHTLAPQTLEALNLLAPDGEDWLAYMRRLLG